MSVTSLPATESWACNCIGPQNGEPRCPCMMRNVIQRNGRWVQIEQDLGPVSPKMQFDALVGPWSTS